MKYVYLWAALPVALTRMACAQCPTIPNPAANAPGPLPSTTAEGFAAIDAAHIAEGIGAGFPPTVSMIETYLPAGYATLNVDQQILALINAERIIRRIPVINGPGDINVAATRATNDPYMGNITANHSLLVAQNAGTWWGLGIVHNNAVDGTLSSRETAPLGPPGITSSGMGEIIAVDHSPEAAVWEWMYNDADSNWGHRDNILNCSWTLMGAGVAASLINTSTWGAGAIVVTVDFIAPGADSTYVAPVIPPPAPCPPVPAKAQWTCPAVVAPKVTGGATLSADGTTINIDATISVDPLYGAANQVQTVLLFQPANWGTASGGVPSLGVAPQGTGAFSCPLVPVPPDPTVDPNAVTSHCVASIPFAGNPMVISSTDTFNGLVYMTTTLTPPIQ